MPLALHERIANADRIVAACDLASAAGLGAGLSLSEARARFPVFDFRPRDAGADARLLEAVADWCDRYTPLVSLDGANGLVLDIAGCAHLFGGERALLADLLARLFALGFAADAAVADGAGTARALAGRSAIRFVGPGEETAAVSPLAVEALRLDPEVAGRLRRLGLKTVRDLLDQPRAALARRFGADLVLKLDEARGHARQPIAPRRAVPPRIAERRFAEPLLLQSDVERVILFLAGRLEGDMEKRAEGGRRFELALFRVDGHVARIEVGASRPLRDPARILRLFRERLAGLGRELEAGFGYDLVRLAVPAAAPLREIQRDLAPNEAEADPDALATLVDRLAARLGEVSVSVAGLDASHWPERAGTRRPAMRRDADAASAPNITRSDGGALRPARLLDRPEEVVVTQPLPDGPPLNFRWRRALHVVRRFEGPERIAPEWWHEAAPTRDYYRVEDECGRRYWLFRQEGRVPFRPDWFMHGLFA